MTQETKCIEELKVYLGQSPYQNHQNVGSGYYYNWLLIKYGKKLINSCMEKLKDEV